MNAILPNTYSWPDAEGRFGPYGGRFVPETLMHPLQELEQEYLRAQADPAFQRELDYYLRFQFYDNKENPLLEEQTIEIAREFFNDQTAILAKENEELMIQKEIYRQAGRMLMVRAQAALESSKSK